MAESQLGSTKSSITMKVDGPSEDKVNQENEENGRNEGKILGINPSQVCSPFSRPILAGSKLSLIANNYKPSGGGGSLLRPSLLYGASSELHNTQSKPAFTLNPSRLNPFAKVPIEDNSFSCDNSEENKRSKPENEETNAKNFNGDTPKFIPLVQDAEKHAQENKVDVPALSTTQTSIAGSSNFVFGQNLKDRVVTDTKTDEPKPSSSNYTNSNGTSEMLFTCALKENSAGPESTANVTRKESKSLSESAREYEEARAVKRKYEEVEIRTGEEEETNVLQMSCKLFTYDKSTGGSWQERGRGTLRLNDQDIGNKVQSRLVFRTSGSLRVILNTKIWPDMSIQQASAKSIRLTAFDNNGEVRVFLVTGNPEDIRLLYKHLEDRVKREKESQEEEINKRSILDSGKPETSPKKLAADTGGD